MVGQGYEKNWVGDDSPAAEAAFHETLVRLRNEGASNQKIAEAVMRSPFILGLVWVVTAKRQLKNSRGARPPLDWAERVASDPELRDEWRCETLYVLGKRLRTKWDDCCDLQRPSIGGYWRVKIIYAAIKAAWTLFEESSLKVRRSGFDLRLMTSLSGVDGILTEGKNLIVVADMRGALHFRIFDSDGKRVVDTDEKRLPEQARPIRALKEQLKNLFPPCEPARSDKDRVIRAVKSIVGYTRRSERLVCCLGEAMTEFPNKKSKEGSNDIRLDLMTAIDELENVRQREVMRLSLDGHSYRDIADRLTETTGPCGAKVTYEMVRGAFERARKVLRTRLTEPAA